MRTMLKELRRKAELTQKQLAERIGCTRENYAMMEAGKSDGSIKLWIAIQKELGVSAEDILYIIAEEA